MPLTLYTLKNLALTPRRTWRRRHPSEAEAGMRDLLDERYYRKPIYQFVNATLKNPGILTDIPIDHDSVVLDVGAYKGEWAEPIWNQAQPTIHCFEPAPRPFAKLVRKFEGNERIHLHQYGLGGADSTASLALAGPGASFYEAEAGFDRIEAPIRDVVTVLDELGLDEIDLIKINIEGGEYDLLDRLAESGKLAKITYVLVQFHEWHPKAYGRRRRNRRALAQQHEEVWCYPWVFELWRRVAD